MVVSRVMVDSLSARRQHARRAAQDRAADAEAERMHPVDAGDLAHDVDRLQRAEGEVVVPCKVADLRHRAAPGDQEDVMALRYGVFDEGIALAEIEQVVLVDTGRHDQQRGLLDLRRHRRVLDQLDQLVLVDDGARRVGEIAADLEPGFVDPRDPPLLNVLDQVLHAGGETRRAGLDRSADHFRIGGGKVRRAHRVDELARVELQLQPGPLVHLRLLDELGELPGAEQIGLLEQVVVRCRRPGIVQEAAIALARLDIAFNAERLDQRRVPEFPDLQDGVALQIGGGHEGRDLPFPRLVGKAHGRRHGVVELLERLLAGLHQALEIGRRIVRRPCAVHVNLRRRATRLIAFSFACRAADSRGGHHSK
jgi:hypothetical protein